MTVHWDSEGIHVELLILFTVRKSEGEGQSLAFAVPFHISLGGHFRADQSCSDVEARLCISHTSLVRCEACGWA